MKEVPAMDEALDVTLTNKIKSFVVDLGADLVGIAPVERWKNAPERLTPIAHLPNARSVIVVAIHHPDASVELGGEPTSQDPGPFQIGMIPKLEEITYHLARFLEERGYDVYPLPGTGYWRHRPYKEIDSPHTADFSHRHAAVAAGLGEFGWHSLLMTPEYGPRQRLSSVITNAPLVPDKLYEGPSLCDMCMECVKACPADAFHKEILPPGVSIVQIEDKTYRYAKKNLWRCIWAEQYGLDLSKIPGKVDEETILEFCKKPEMRRGGEFGKCLRYCMPPHLRYRDPDYCRVFRRKKEKLKVVSERWLTQQVKSIAVKEGADMVGVTSLEWLKDSPVKPKEGYPWQVVLKNFSKVVVVGIDYPKSYFTLKEELPVQLRDSLSFIERAVYVKLSVIQWRVAAYLDNLGFEAMQTWRDISNLTDYAVVALGWKKSRVIEMKPGIGRAGVRRSDRRAFSSVITNAPLAVDEWREDD